MMWQVAAGILIAAMIIGVFLIEWRNEIGEYFIGSWVPPFLMCVSLIAGGLVILIASDVIPPPSEKWLDWLEKGYAALIS